MKRKLCIVLVLIITALSITACSSGKNNKMPKTVSTITEADLEKLENELKQMQIKYDNITRIYDESLTKSINAYCEQYLSYDSLTTKNTDSLKDYVTEDLYIELSSQAGHQKSNEKYEQSTGIDCLYYSDNSAPCDNINVAALCKQTVIYNDKTEIQNAVYIFNMLYQNNEWKINSVESI